MKRRFKWKVAKAAAGYRVFSDHVTKPRARGVFRDLRLPTATITVRQSGGRRRSWPGSRPRRLWAAAWGCCSTWAELCSRTPSGKRKVRRRDVPPPALIGRVNGVSISVAAFGRNIELIQTLLLNNCRNTWSNNDIAFCNTNETISIHSHAILLLFFLFCSYTMSTLKWITHTL